eukprot:3186260-Pyramimonas_sp.AAC.1
MCLHCAALALISQNEQLLEPRPNTSPEHTHFMRASKMSRRLYSDQVLHFDLGARTSLVGPYFTPSTIKQTYLSLPGEAGVHGAETS